jgi:hypothetical protein
VKIDGVATIDESNARADVCRSLLRGDACSERDRENTSGLLKSPGRKRGMDLPSVA